jgi:hypothetical protein
VPEKRWIIALIHQTCVKPMPDSAFAVARPRGEASQ